eukprot:TRINITY_DN2868_c0_g2_i1.p1 TRINITY_DN2868_c0_g2~~TRINITY_DN2868_c0_g2_i1.p1  ORF type:complete len:501 (+),score=96.79 TRINITY_DN2868_c0_g2_i1:101-1603(+)
MPMDSTYTKLSSIHQEGKANQVSVEEDAESQIPMLGPLCTPREGSGPIDTDNNGAPTNGAEKVNAQEKAMVNVVASFVLSRQGSCSIETESVYGAAIVLPQLARSLQWQRELTISAFRSYMFVVLSIVMQLLILMMMEKHETVLDPFAGQMFLCDMGAWCTGVDEDPVSCKGPGGTTITPPRLYSYDIWSTRVFVRESLKAIFPGKAEEIDKVADPGEYGMESYNCRFLRCILFMMTMLQEARNIIDTAWLLYKVPTEAESWIIDDEPEERKSDPDHGLVPGERGESKGDEPRSTEPILEEDWLERINLQIAGMPMKWKVFNALILLLPKAMIWQLTVTTGIVFLMETAGIDDLVVNSVALTFILDIDELCCKTLTEEYIRGLLSRVRPFPLFNFSKATESYGSEDILQEQSRQELRKKMRRQDLFWALFPTKLLLLIAAWFWFVFSYYSSHCYPAPVFGRFWPKLLYLAKSTAFSFANAFLPGNFPVPTETEAVWTMPE